MEAKKFLRTHTILFSIVATYLPLALLLVLVVVEGEVPALSFRSSHSQRLLLIVLFQKNVISRSSSIGMHE